MLVAVYDACVLYPAPLRDFLLHLVLADAVRGKWTRHIHEEWIGALLARRPDLARAQLERTRRLMDAHVRDSLVTGYEDLIETLKLPDPNDRHVLAAAIAARADVIVTFNLAHFPKSILASYGIDVMHPDALGVAVASDGLLRVLSAAREHRASLMRPRKTVEAYLTTLEAQKMPRTAALLRSYAAFL